MPINTKNAAALLGGTADRGGTRRVTFLKQTYVTSLGRNSAIGETAAVSDGDARFLLAYKYAVKAEEAPVEEVKTEEPKCHPVPVVEEGTEVPTETEPETVEESGEEPARRFSRRRRG